MKALKSRSRRLTLTVAALIGSLVLGACSGSSPSSDTVGDSPIRLAGYEPATALLPGLARDEPGRQILRLVMEGLTNYTPEGKLNMAAAQSITSPDNRVWTIGVRRDWTFSNGEAMTAKNFVDAWNYLADHRNAQPGVQVVENIEGYTPKLEGPLPGLRLVDDYTIEVTLKAPAYNFADRLSDVSMYPLPESAFKDLDAYGRLPFGSGQYVLEKRVRGVSYTFKKNPRYRGAFTPKNSGLEFTVYTTTTAAYSDYLSGSIDILLAPNDKLANVKIDSDSRMIVKPANAFAFFGIPAILQGFGYDRAGILRRQAVSMAINREEIIKTLFHDYYFPATGFLASSVFPKLQNVEGSDNAKFDVEKAKKLWAEAQAIEPLPTDFKVQFYYNVDGGHGPWVEAVSHMLNVGLGLEVIPRPVSTFSEYVPLAKTVKGFIRSGWNGTMTPSGVVDYMFLPTGTTNYGRFDNLEFNELNRKALAETDPGKRTGIWRQMFSILMEELPVIPMWYYGIVTMYSAKVGNVRADVNGNPVLWEAESR